MSLNATSLISQAHAIRDATALAMERDSSIFVTGEGVTDPRGIFGTTLDLVDRFGKERVFDAPLSENGITGICIGAALCGLKPILVISRIEFALLAMDQLVNNAARWQSIFGSDKHLPIVIRIIFGKGYGVDPNHSRDLQSLFGQIPGLKTVMPTGAVDAKGMLLAAIEESSPVVFLEHRYLHDTIDDVPDGYYTKPLLNAEKITDGNHITIAAFSYSVFSSLKAADALKLSGIEVEVINMRSINPLDVGILCDSVKKTGRLIIADTGTNMHGIAANIIFKVIENSFLYLSNTPAIVSACDEKTDPLFGTQTTINAINIAKVAINLANTDSNKIQILQQTIKIISDEQYAEIG